MELRTVGRLTLSFVPFVAVSGLHLISGGFPLVPSLGILEVDLGSLGLWGWWVGRSPSQDEVLRRMSGFGRSSVGTANGRLMTP